MAFLRRLFGRTPPPTASPPPPAAPPLAATTPPPTPPPAPPPTTTGGADEPDDDALAQALLAFLQAPMDQMGDLLRATPLLMTPAAVALLAQMGEDAQAEQPNLAEMMAAYAGLLRFAQQNGIDAMLAALASAAADDPAAPDKDTAIAQALDELLGTEQWSATRRVLEARRDLLLTDAAAQMLIAAAEQAEQRGDTRQRDYLMLHARLLANARDQGTDAAWPIFLREARPFSNTPTPDAPDDLFTQWLTTPTYREERRFLRQYPELIGAASEERLTALIEAVTNDTTLDPKERTKTVDALRGQRYLLHDIRERVAQLTQQGGAAVEQSVMNQAIADSYVNWRGGFMLDIPAWLEAVNEQDARLRQEGHPYETAHRRAALWQEALRRTDREGLAAEIGATIARNIWDALDDVAGSDKAAAQEDGIAHLTLSLRVFTEEHFPYQWSMLQNDLGNTYQNRIRGDKAANLEEAIVCYSAALRIYTEDVLPLDWAMTQNNLGNTYQTRIRGDKAANLEEAIACYSAALRIYTEDALPLDWAMTQNNLGITYQERIRGDKAANLEEAIACYSAALRVRTEDALPHNHRGTVLSLAATLAERERWGEADAAYRSALHTEDALVALAGDARGQDAILADGRDGAARDAFALARLGRHADAAAVLEQGLARGLAAARALDAADPQRIGDSDRRADYLAKRAAWQAALVVVQQAEARLPRPEDVPPEMRDALRRQREEQHARQRMLAQQLAQARAAFDDAVAAIRAAYDPADFLRDEVSAATLMQAAQRGPAGHAIVALVATPWGGMALGALTANPRASTRDRFTALDLPTFTNDAMFALVSQALDGEDGQILGGFGYAQEGSTLGFLQRDWADRERPTWDATVPLQEWEARDQPRRDAVQDDATFAAMAGWLRDTCRERAIDSTLDAACQDVLAEAGLRLSINTPWRDLDDQQLAHLSGAIGHAFLLRELERSLTTLSDLVMRPLAAWLREQGVTSVTLIPCGWLSAFPLLACDVGAGQTFADAFTASVAPSFRALLSHERTRRRRQGVATLGNPWPTHQPLKYGQAEALTLAHLGGDPARCRIQHDATRAWLLECLRDALVVDASCHGAAYEDYLASCLQLADYPLTLADALNHQVADPYGLRLLILSACQTAIPDLRGARNEARSLAVGMLQAGVEAVIAALWSVDDRATYLLIVRFAQEWFPNMATEPPAAALARAQRWLRAVTWGELQAWEATSLLPTIFATMPDYRPADQRPPATADAARLATVRGGASYPLADADAASDDPAGATRDTRYDMHEGQENVRVIAGRRDPDQRPYEHPFFWAGFQVTGW